MKQFEVQGHEPSFLPDGNWSLTWADEFDGTALDRSKWVFRTSMMGLRWPAWTENGVYLDGNSHAVFTLLEEDGHLVSSQLQTGHNFMDEPVQKTTFGKDHLQWNIGKLYQPKFLHGPGYFECRCRLQQKAGWWSAFWIQSPVIGASLDSRDTGSEIDIMESFKPGNIIQHCVHTGGYGLDLHSVSAGAPQDLDPTVFHRFGLLWDRDGYTFYVDGKEDGRVEENQSERPEFILVSTEILGYRDATHTPRPEAYEAVGDTFLVDYVRVFDEI